MNYIYDILINLQKNLYDFFEWNLSDDIMHVRKIPLIKVSTPVLQSIKNNIIQLNEDTLRLIYNRTEVFTSHNVRIIKYLCLFSDDQEVFAVEFDKVGTKTRISKLLIDEELEIIEVSEQIEVSNIEFNIKGKSLITNFKTRKELKIYDYILKQLNKENYERLKYLYFECFDKEEEDLHIIVKDLKRSIVDNWKDIYEKIYSFLRLSSQKQ